jgi:hypothetical protein
MDALSHNTQTLRAGSQVKHSKVENHKVTIISAYQVVSNIVKSGSTTSASQQSSLLLRSNDPIKTPKAAFRRDLQKHIQQSQSAGHDIILTGDFNETLGQDLDGLTKVISSCNLVDVMSARHPETLHVTYSRGRRCLDYVFVSPRIVPAVTRCGYEAFGN